MNLALIRSLIIWTLLLMSFTLYAQFPGVASGMIPGMYDPSAPQSRIKYTEGDPEALEQLKIAGIVFDYSRMTVSKYQNLDEYLTNIKDPKTLQKQEWLSMFTELLEPTFLKTFALHAADRGINLKLTPDTLATKVDLIVEVLNVNPDRQNKSDANSFPPNISFYYTFLNSDGSLVARFVSKGMGPNSKDLKIRLRECYAVAGKMLATEIHRTIVRHNRKKKN